MGGSAFASGPNALFTPRMPPDVYTQVRERCKAALRQLFVCVAAPIEGPGKKDHGDVDLIVALPRRLVFGADDPASSEEEYDFSFAAQVQVMARALGAERTIVNADNSCHIAVPWPADEAQEERPRFVQVDVRVCASIPQLQWMLFKHAHGDIWNLLGSITRRYGLTVDDEALWVRVPEIEAHNRRRAKVFLTADPAMVLEFLGLTQAGTVWEEPFESAEAMFEYVATCRLFSVSPAAQEAGEQQQQEEAEEDRSKLKSNERRRMGQRDIYRRWIEEFVPQCRAQGRFPPAAVPPTRESVRREALARFGLARWFYEKRLAEWRHERQEEEVWRSAIKASVPQDLDPQHRGVLCSALKRIVMREDESFGVSRADHPAFKTEDGWYLVDQVREWVVQHWKEVEDVAWQRQLERARENMRLKEMKCKAAVAVRPYDRGASSVPVS
ncbi:hypothetical protein NKR23_g725 [Pleurostoma richardsiae]|uniref:Uncharacterized protein n=1 Tax=Pleurostoma richardsiae TaxID=41990 RepID=A0AA38W0I2_9PEZI|nr:hypothetical protein NKR23_g725 [Pleurostoma richardsiae]